MADQSIQVTPGTGPQIDFRTEATNSNYRQVVVLGDPDLNAGVAPVSATLGLSVNVTNTGIDVTFTNTSIDANITNSSLNTIAEKSSTASVATVSASATAVTVLVSNALRKGFIIYNDSTEIVYIKFGSSAATNDFTFKLFPESAYEHTNNLYTGVITAIWVNAVGVLEVTEMT